MEDLNLRPMTLGEVLDRTFRLYKSNFWLFIGVTALPYLLILLFQIGVAAMASSFGQGSQPPNVTPGFIGRIFTGFSIGFVFYLIIYGYTLAATIFAVSDVYLARTATVRGSFAKVGAKILRIMLIFFFILIAAIVAIIVVGIVAGILGAITRSAPLIFVLFIVCGLAAVILFCRLALWIPAAMLENVGAGNSFQRSMYLTEGYALQFFLIYLLVGVLTYAAILVFQAPFFAIAGRAAASHQALPFGIAVLQDLGAFMSQVLVGPIGTIATSLMYYNLRVRKEAFDIQHLMSSLQATATPGPAATT